MRKVVLTTFLLFALGCTNNPIKNQFETELSLLNAGGYQHMHPDQLASVLEELGAPNAAFKAAKDPALRGLLKVQNTGEGVPRANLSLSPLKYKELFKLIENGCSEAKSEIFGPGVVKPSQKQVEEFFTRIIGRYAAKDEIEQAMSVVNSAQNPSLAVCVYVMSSLEGLHI